MKPGITILSLVSTKTRISLLSVVMKLFIGHFGIHTQSSLRWENRRRNEKTGWLVLTGSSQSHTTILQTVRKTEVPKSQCFWIMGTDFKKLIFALFASQFPNKIICSPVSALCLLLIIPDSIFLYYQLCTALHPRIDNSDVIALTKWITSFLAVPTMDVSRASEQERYLFLLFI